MRVYVYIVGELIFQRVEEAKNFGWGRTLTAKTVAQQDSHADAVA